MNSAFLLLGSNLGDRFALLQHAKEEISSSSGKIIKESSVYESEPWGFNSNDRFLNQVIKIATKFTVLELLDEVLRIENKLGRQRSEDKGYSSRTIDIDILFYNDEIISEEKLIVPHPKIADRKFTLIPLVELEPAMIHPVFGKSLSALLNDCNDTLSVNLYHSK